MSSQVKKIKFTSGFISDLIEDINVFIVPEESFFPPSFLPP
jgi:hypothetical protein